jgi:protocatechuate 3,4-dioxygenase beta subunit
MRISGRKMNKWWRILLLVLLILFVWYRAGIKIREPRAVSNYKESLKPSSAQTESPAAGTAVPSFNAGLPPTFRKFDEFEFSKYESGTEYVVAGRVTSDDGDPLPGATVTIYRNISLIAATFEDLLAAATCDGTGHYKIHLDLPVTAWIEVRKEGYAHLMGRLDVRSPGVVTRNYSLRDADAGVEGQVFEKGGKPLADAFVMAYRASRYISPTGAGPGPRSARTDQSGRYSISDLPAEEARIRAFTNRHVEAVKAIILKSGQYQHVDFELNPAATILLTVKDQDGKGIPLASVYGRSSSATDEHGVATLTLPVDSAPFDCTVEARGFKPKTFLLDPKKEPAEAVLDNADIFRGQVLSESGTPLAGATLEIHPSDAQGAVISDSAGMFSVTVSIPPVREIMVSKPGYMAGWFFYHDENQKCPPFLEIRLKRVEGGIYGRVINEAGRPVTSFGVALFDTSSESSPPRFGKYFDNEEGLFSITEVPAGTYKVAVFAITDPTTNQVQKRASQQIEIRKGLFFGEVLVQLSAPANPRR